MTADRMIEIRGMYELLVDTGVAMDVSVERYLADVGDLLAHSRQLEARIEKEIDTHQAAAIVVNNQAAEIEALKQEIERQKDFSY